MVEQRWIDIGPIPPNFDGEAFAEANNLKPTDFEVHDGILRVPEGSPMIAARPVMPTIDTAKNAKKKRVKVVKKLDDDGGKLMIDLAEAMYAELQKSKPRKFAELMADVVGKFVGGSVIDVRGGK